MKVFISRQIPDAGLQILKEAGCSITEYTEKAALPQEELITICKTHDALLSAGPNKLDNHFFEECKHLKVVSLLSVGYDNVNLAAASNHKIPVSNTPGVLSHATSDVAFLLMLAVSRKAFFMNETIRNGSWHFYEPTANLGIELYGKTLGIFGLGKIGFELAVKCKAAYHMSIVYHNRTRNMMAEEKLNARYLSFDELLKQSDVLSVHANLSEQTRGLFDKTVFQKMKPSSIFINTGRGALHNETDLTEAVQQGTIWGAGLDVTHPEPMQPDNPLLTMPTVCVLPHIGSATKETRDKMAMLAANNIVAGLRGKPLPNILNSDVYDLL